MLTFSPRNYNFFSAPPKNSTLVHPCTEVHIQRGTRHCDGLKLKRLWQLTPGPKALPWCQLRSLSHRLKPCKNQVHHIPNPQKRTHWPPKNGSKSGLPPESCLCWYKSTFQMLRFCPMRLTLGLQTRIHPCEDLSANPSRWENIPLCCLYCLKIGVIIISMIYRKEVDGRSIKLKIQQEFKLNKYYLLYSKSTMLVLISSYLWGKVSLAAAAIAFANPISSPSARLDK